MPLERFRKAKEPEIAMLRTLAAKNCLPRPFSGHRPPFSRALIPTNGRPAIIAEYKRASPSRGIIRQDLDIASVCVSYAAAKASAISILTEQQFFHGDISYLACAAKALLQAGFRTPLLRKDFCFDPLQIQATAATPASALLLIVRLTPDPKTLQALQEYAQSFGLETVVEVFDEEDLAIARASGASIIQVNARDLASLAVCFPNVLDLAQKHPPKDNELWIAASGITTPSQILQASRVGFSACLIGTHLMETANPATALALFVEPTGEQQ